MDADGAGPGGTFAAAVGDDAVTGMREARGATVGCFVEVNVSGLA